MYRSIITKTIVGDRKEWIVALMYGTGSAFYIGPFETRQKARLIKHQIDAALQQANSLRRKWHGI